MAFDFFSLLLSSLTLSGADWRRRRRRTREFFFQMKNLLGLGRCVQCVRRVFVAFLRSYSSIPFTFFLQLFRVLFLSLCLLQCVLQFKDSSGDLSCFFYVFQVFSQKSQRRETPRREFRASPRFTRADFIIQDLIHTTSPSFTRDFQLFFFFSST